MKISLQLVAGLALTLLSAYYWSAFGHSPVNQVPAFFRYSYRLFNYADMFITVVGMFLFYSGLKRLRG